MKKYLLLALALTGCQASTYQTRVDSCNDFALKLKKEDGFVQKCASDDATFSQAYEDSLELESPEFLCVKAMYYPNTPSSNLALSIAKRKGADCRSIQEHNAKATLAETDISTLCSAWAGNWGNDVLRSAVKSEVKSRGADCSQIVAAEAQAAAAREQAAAARSQAAAAWQNALNSSRPRHTTCNSTFGVVNCSSY